MKKKKRVVCIFIAGLLSAGCCFFIIHSKKEEEGQIYAQKVSEVTGYEEHMNRFPGIVESKGTEDFNLDPEKKLLELYVTQGQKVEAGEALYKYDDSQIKNSISSAQLEMEGTGQSVQLLKKEIKDLEEQLKQAAEEEKYKIRSEISDKQMEIKQYEYDIQTKQNEIANLKKDLEQSVVKTNTGGIVKSVNRNSTKESEKQEVFLSVIQDEEYVVKGLVDETSVESLKENDPVIVRSRVSKDRFWKGTVSSLRLDPEKEKEQENTESVQEKASRYPFYVTLEGSVRTMTNALLWKLCSTAI